MLATLVYTLHLFAILASTVSGLSIVEASIEDLQQALSNNHINAVKLVANHLHRIAQYDRRGPRLNSIPIINPLIFEHAQASDEYRAQNGSIRSSLEGIPGTLKDSYTMAGLTVASGSPAFENLTASTDAFTVQQLRSGGAIIIGKTNMPPMANGGMQRGVYGRAESPYNKDYLTAAYASGSSNGAGTSTAASFGVFAMAEEIVSSGRSPASNNGLVAYTPSRGILSIRGNWPLSPVADVVVPYARTVTDLLTMLDTLVADDPDTTSDFWRGQPFVSLPPASSMRPPTSYKTLANKTSLNGTRIGVPKMYIGEHDPSAQPTWVNPAIRTLWSQAKATLESLGATVLEVDFPLVTNFEAPGHAAWETAYPLPGRVENPALAGPRELASYASDDFLRMVNDTSISHVTDLSRANPELIFPQLPRTLPDRYGNTFNNRTASNTALVASIAARNNSSIFSLPGLSNYLQALETRRKEDFESWLDAQNLSALVWPSAGDIGRSDSETNETAAVHAWRNGVFFSHGNYAIRQFGVPTVSVFMGVLGDTGMPVDLTFAGRAYSDNELLGFGFAFEQGHQRRAVPGRTPGWVTDVIDMKSGGKSKCAPGPSIVGTKALRLTADVRRLCGDGVIRVSGSVDVSGAGELESITVFVDGVEVRPVTIQDGEWSVVTRAVPYDDPVGDVPVRVVNKPDQSLAMVVVIATARNGRSDGKLLFV
ncbi:amidase signature domain-containing protein [Aspergillus karnatakaensis]|uniref:amidase signature domain-containing protein n=1 Tax=Aspergillus karnatakaensis TaxID=1810916 RepID=UPI003CCD817C